MMRTFARSRAILLCLLVICLWRAEPAKAEPMMLGVVTHFDQGWSYRLLHEVRTSGARSIRDEVQWGSIERVPGRYDFSAKSVWLLRQACKRGADVLLVLTPKNRLYDGGRYATSPAARTAFANYAVAVVDHFRGCVTAIQLGNEINGHGALSVASGNDPFASYVEMQKAVYSAIKARRPDIIVVGGSTNAIGTGFLDRIFRKGGLESMDAVSIHPYRAIPENVDFEIEHLRATMRRSGRELPIWVTEFGDYFRTPELAPPHLVKMVSLLGAAGVERAYWYALIDEPWWPNMGLYHPDGHPKPASEAYRFAGQELLGRARPQRIDAGDRRTFVFRYGADRYVIWGAARPISFEGRAVIRDARGRILADVREIGSDPIIVTGASGYRLGPNPVLADSRYEYGRAPWDYLALSPSGTERRLGLMDTDFTTTFGDAAMKPLFANYDAAAPAGNAPSATRIVIRYVADAPRRARVWACFSRKAEGDGMDLEIARNGVVLYRSDWLDRLAITDLEVDLQPADRLDFRMGPYKVWKEDNFAYRIRLLDAASGIRPNC